MSEALFFIVFGLIVYTYFGYPYLLTLVSLFFKIKIKKLEIYPSVSMVIAAYNEEKYIARKIANSLSLDYPKDKLEIIVTSDCSSDKTNSIVESFAGRNVKLLVSRTRKGKTAGRNMSVPHAKGEIIVFSDATGLYEPDALKKLIRNFNDERVGCVGGLLRYMNPSNSMVGSGEGLYWKYEVMIKEKESLLGNLTSVSGSIYAFRKKLYNHIPEELADDLIVPLMIKKSGYYVILEPEAVCAEETTKEGKEEASKRARIANRNIMGLIFMKELFNFFKYGFFSLELLSHKILRLLMPFLLISLFIVNQLLIFKSPFYALFALAQIAFYASAILGHLIQKRIRKRNRFLYISLFFCLSNLSVFFGVLRFLAGQKKTIWEPAR